MGLQSRLRPAPAARRIHALKTRGGGMYVTPLNAAQKDLRLQKITFTLKQYTPCRFNSLSGSTKFHNAIQPANVIEPTYCGYI